MTKTEEKKGAKKVSPKKAESVAKLTDKLARARAFFLTDYRGLTHQQLENLKKALKKVEGEFVVAKNTLLKIALEKDEKLQRVKASKSQSFKEIKEKLAEELKNPTATLFAYADEMAAIKTLANFIKNTQLPKIKLGIFEGKLATEADFTKLANIPSREVLLSTLVVRLKAPIYGLHFALSWNMQRLVAVLTNIKSKKS